MSRSRALLLALLVASPSSAQLPLDAPTTACLTDGRVFDLLLHDGVVYLAGQFSHVRPPGTEPGSGEEVVRLWFAACDAATGAVLAWDPQVACDPGISNCNNADGRTVALAAGAASLYLGGKFNQVQGATRRNAARVAVAGAAVEAWHPAPNDRVQRIVAAPGGDRVYVAGNFTALDACPPEACPAHLAAVDPATGAVDPTFDPRIECDDQGGDCFTTVYAVLPEPEGHTVYFGGQFGAVNGLARDSAAAVDAATGQAATDFAPALEDNNPSDPAVQVHDVVFDGDWIYLCGDWWSTGGIGGQQDQRNVNRFDPGTGAVDSGFWIATDGGVQACAFDESAGALFVGGHFDCVREWLDSTTPADPAPAQCGGDPLFVGTPQRDLFALDLAAGSLLPWNPDTGGAPGVWAMARTEGRLALGGEVHWPRTAPSPTHRNLLLFDLPLFADGFERGDTERWSATQPLP